MINWSQCKFNSKPQILEVSGCNLISIKIRRIQSADMRIAIPAHNIWPKFHIESRRTKLVLHHKCPLKSKFVTEIFPHSFSIHNSRPKSKQAPVYILRFQNDIVCTNACNTYLIVSYRPQTSSSANNTQGDIKHQQLTMRYFAFKTNFKHVILFSSECKLPFTCIILVVEYMSF